MAGLSGMEMGIGKETEPDFGCMHRCHSARKRGDVQSRQENEKRKSRGKESRDVEGKKKPD